MSVDYAAIAAEAATAIADVGVQVTILTRGAVTGPDYAPTFGADTEHSASGVLTSYSAAELRAEYVQIGDRKLLVQAAGLDHIPTTEDRVQIGSDAFAVVNVEAVAPANEPVMWKLQVRQA